MSIAGTGIPVSDIDLNASVVGEIEKSATLCEGHAFLARYFEPLMRPAMAADTESGIGIHKALFVDIQHLLLLLLAAICPVVLISPISELDQQREDNDLHCPGNYLA